MPPSDLPEAVLDIAEIPYESGAVRIRYSRYFSADGTRGVRHGLFVAYYESGQPSSEGEYRDGLEQGVWRNYHSNGQVAAEGMYVSGKEEGYWRFWDTAGREEMPVEYHDGVEVS
jgi:antitoxin component YwqK of YwqJK toxin-antitoxin module